MKPKMVVLKFDQKLGSLSLAQPLFVHRLGSQNEDLCEYRQAEVYPGLYSVELDFDSLVCPEEWEEEIQTVGFLGLHQTVGYSRLSTAR